MRRGADAIRPGAPRISAGVLAGDLLNLGDEVARLRGAGVDLLHVDVMDGRFAGPIMGGPAVVRALAGMAATDVHLMVEDPLRHAIEHAEAGATAVTFHVEATDEPRAVLAALGDRGAARGVALSPGTSVDVLVPLLEEVELVLVLAVDPRTRHPAPFEGTVARLGAVRALVGDRDVTVSVDGGVTVSSAAALAAAGADVVVSGGALFAAPGPEAAVPAMLRAIAAGQPDSGNGGAGPRGTTGQTSATTSSST